MHVCQIMLVEADTALEAFEKIYEKLSGESQPNWSDWHNVGNPESLNYAGRWTNHVFKLDGAIEDGTELSPNYLQYSDDTALAEKVIDDYLAQRKKDMDDCRKEMVDLSTAPYDPLISEWKDPNHMGIYYAKKLAQLLSNEWTPDTGIYDLDSWTASLAYFIERVKKAPEKQWLIPVDFHF